METANILVCEDERLIARDIEAALSRNGYRVVGIAANGEEAIRIAKEKLPDLALMDIRLKGPLSGIEVAGTLVDELGIPSIFLTAYADDDTLSHAKATQPLSYLVKPFNEVELKAVVEVALHRYREQRHIVGALHSYIDEHCDTDAVEKALGALKRFRALCDTMGVEKLWVLATAASRDAKNGREFIAAAQRICRAKIDVISGPREAELTALGVVSGFHRPNGVVGSATPGRSAGAPFTQAARALRPAGTWLPHTVGRGLRCVRVCDAWWPADFALQ